MIKKLRVYEVVATQPDHKPVRVGLLAHDRSEVIITMNELYPNHKLSVVEFMPEWN